MKDSLCTGTNMNLQGHIPLTPVCASMCTTDF